MTDEQRERPRREQAERQGVNVELHLAYYAFQDALDAVGARTAGEEGEEFDRAMMVIESELIERGLIGPLISGPGSLEEVWGGPDDGALRLRVRPPEDDDPEQG
jgi:hypothetical protein